MLWVVCLIHYKRERNESISQRAIKDEFGEEVNDIFQTYVVSASDQNLLDYETMQLTDRGMSVVRDWEAINRKLYSF